MCSLLGLLVLSGCLGPGPDDALQPPVDAQSGGVYVELQAPRSLYDRSELAVWIEAPDGTQQEGTLGTHYEDYVMGLPQGNWPIRATGDLHAEEPGVIGPYPYMFFPNVTYNGTWVVTLKLVEASSIMEDASGIDRTQDSYCARIYFSEPHKVPLDRRYARAADEYLSDAIIHFDWATTNSIVEPTHGSGCNSEPAPEATESPILEQRPVNPRKIHEWAPTP